MMKLFFIAVFFLFVVNFSQAQDTVPVLDFESFEHYLHQNNDTVYVVNFWATWCKPCVEELPAFEQLNQEFKNDKVKVLLVSLDFIKHYQTKLLPFIEDRELKSTVLLLNDPRSNSWIDKVSPEWSGAIPATLIYKGEERQFYEKSFSYETLQAELNRFLLMEVGNDEQ